MSRVWRRLSSRLRQKDDARESGTTLIELMVGMTVMGVFMVMFTAAITSMFSSTTTAESLAQTSGQLSTAFNRLDSTVRYATALSQPGESGGSWYVELQSVDRETAAVRCTQLRVTGPSDANGAAPRQLQQRTWTVTSPGAKTGLTTFTPVASDIINGSVAPGAQQPFTRVAATAAVPYQQLRVVLRSSLNSLGDRVSVSDTTFTALNSAPTTPLSGICTEAGRR